MSPLEETSEVDAIVAEVREVRHEIAAEYGYDPEAFRRDLLRREGQGEIRTVSRPPRRPEPLAQTGS